MTHRFLRAALLAGLAAAAPVLAQARDTRDAREPFEAEIARLAGRDAQQCGIFPLGKDAASGWACAQAAERAGRPWWLAFEGMGDDSLAGRAAIRTSAGVHLLLDYDSSPFGSGLYPRLTTMTCPWPVLYQPAEPVPLDCQAPRPAR